MSSQQFAKLYKNYIHDTAKKNKIRHYAGEQKT